MAQRFDTAPIDIHGTPIPVKLRVNKRAKRLIVRVDPLAPAILLTCPSSKHIKDAYQFAAERKDWIAGQLAEAPVPQAFEPGAIIPVKGVNTEIVHLAATRRSIDWKAQEAKLIVGGELRYLNRRVEDWLRRKARQEFSGLADQFCATLGVKRGRITVRDTKSRWGSCSSNGCISLSWRLIMAPVSVYSYVVAHEVAHIRHMDHSPAFWSTVDTLISDRHESKYWLEQHGCNLYSFGIERTSAFAEAAA